jgi:hypothetical protein
MSETTPSDFLFAQPSWLSGVARLLDLSGQLDGYNVTPSPEQADARATYADWKSTGESLQSAFDAERQQQTDAAEQQLTLDLR